MVLQTVVVDCHDRALHYIHRSIGKKHLPETGSTLIHFDAHPDLAVPKNVDYDNRHNFKQIEELVSIESWIIPLLINGFVSTVVWYGKFGMMRFIKISNRL